MPDVPEDNDVLALRQRGQMMFGSKTFRLAVFLLLATCVDVSAQRDPDKVLIFVGPQIREGFVDIDSGVLDSIKDIKEELRGDKTLQIVAERDRAQIVLEVLSRGATSTSSGGAVGMPIGASTFLIPIGTIGIRTVLRVGSYEKQIVFQNCGGWRYCAKLVAKDVQVWTSANASTIAKK